MDCANMTRMAPAANAIDIEITAGGALAKTVYPITDAKVPITVATDHNMSMYLLLIPEAFIWLVEPSASGRFETKIATRKAIFNAPPAASVIPRAAFSGILSITDPMNNVFPDVGLLTVAVFLSSETAK